MILIRINGRSDRHYFLWSAAVASLCCSACCRRPYRNAGSCYNHLEQAVADERGILFRKTNENSNFTITAKKSGFFTAPGEGNNIGKIFSDTLYVTLALEEIVINKPIVLENIYYDYNKWAIRSDAAIELDRLVKILKDNPEINIELSSHTDSRGSDKYNLTLSQKRAQSAVDYIIQQGIASERIYAKGYGETRLRNKCGNKIKCDDAAHQENRRTEFTVVKINGAGEERAMR